MEQCRGVVVASTIFVVILYLIHSRDEVFIDACWVSPPINRESYFMWDSFTSGVAVSIMLNSHNHHGENEFAETEYMNITVVTSNKPYGISEGSNPLFDGLEVPKFDLKKDGVHSGHIQRGLRDPFCLVKNGKGRCKVFSMLPGFSAELMPKGREKESQAKSTSALRRSGAR